MEQIPGWIKQWHQQMPSLREGAKKKELRARTWGPPRRWKMLAWNCCWAPQLRLVPTSDSEPVVIPQPDPVTNDFSGVWNLSEWDTVPFLPFLKDEPACEKSSPETAVHCFHGFLYILFTCCQIAGVIFIPLLLSFPQSFAKKSKLCLIQILSMFCFLTTTRRDSICTCFLVTMSYCECSHIYWHSWAGWNRFSHSTRISETNKNTNGVETDLNVLQCVKQRGLLFN